MSQCVKCGWVDDEEDDFCTSHKGLCPIHWLYDKYVISGKKKGKK